VQSQQHVFGYIPAKAGVQRHNQMPQRVGPQLDREDGMTALIYPVAGSICKPQVL